jgi:hypothetical protein
MIRETRWVELCVVLSVVAIAVSGCAAQMGPGDLILDYDAGVSNCMPDQTRDGVIGTSFPLWFASEGDGEWTIDSVELAPDSGLRINGAWIVPTNDGEETAVFGVGFPLPPAVSDDVSKEAIARAAKAWPTRVDIPGAKLTSPVRDYTLLLAVGLTGAESGDSGRIEVQYTDSSGVKHSTASNGHIAMVPLGESC